MCSCVAEDLYIHRTQHYVGLSPAIPAVDSAYRTRLATRSNISDTEPRAVTAAARGRQEHTRGRW